jgi:hypothetical protein
VESLTKLIVDEAKLSARSRPVIVSLGPLVVPALQLKRFETYGPPAGVATREEVCVQPLAPPASALVELEAGPESASATAFPIVKEPPAAPR